MKEGEEGKLSERERMKENSCFCLKMNKWSVTVGRKGKERRMERKIMRRMRGEYRKRKKMEGRKVKTKEG